MRLQDYRKKYGARAFADLASRAGTSEGYLRMIMYQAKRPGVDMAGKIIAGSGGEVEAVDLLPELFSHSDDCRQGIAGG